MGHGAKHGGGHGSKHGKHASVEVKGAGLAKLQKLVNELGINPEVKIGILANSGGHVATSAAKTVIHKSTTKTRTPGYGVSKETRIRSIEHKEASAGQAGSRGTIDNVMIATVHEFGSPKMKIPERSWLRATADRKRSEWLDLMAKVLGKVVDGHAGGGHGGGGHGLSVMSALEIVGLRASSDVKAGILRGSGIPPPLKASTIARKGSSRPLVDTGQLVNSISYQVKAGGHDGGGHH